jgi:hypothetical protein
VLGASGDRSATLKEDVMQDRFVVEANRRVVGIGVRVPGGFRFFSSDPAFLSLEGRTFTRARSLASKVAEFARERLGKKRPRSSNGKLRPRAAR